MGLKFSKPGPGKAGNTTLVLQPRMLAYLTASSSIQNQVSKQRRRMIVGGEVCAGNETSGALQGEIYNLCIEEDYDPSHFHGRVEKFPFDDNHVPTFEMMKLLCESVYSWLSNDPKNIAVIHCMSLYQANVVMWAIGKKYFFFLGELHNGPPDVNLPQPCSRELRRIRLYDTVNTTSVFFVVSELQKIPNQLYRPPVEVAKNCCREIKKGCEANSSPRYFLSVVEGDEEGTTSESEEPRVLVQMDIESPVLYQKTYLDYHFNKPVGVTGDVRVIFYQKMIGGRLFYACFNTTFIKNGLLQFTIRDMDKVGCAGRSICGPAFCVELLFGPANPKHSITSSDESVPEI